MFVLIIFSFACIVFWIAAIALTKKRQRKQSVQRVSVQAIVNHYARNGGRNRPPEVIFDYPLPNGQWHRAQQTVVLNPTSEKGFFDHMSPGDTFTIYVDPQNPYDVYLGSKYDITTIRMYLCYGIAIFTTLMVISNILRLTLN